MELINVTYHDPVHGQLHVVVSSALGDGGSSFSVVINNYFKGQIVRYRTGWTSFVETPMLMQDDIDAIFDAIYKFEAEAS